jgi:hypothetical protein
VATELTCQLVHVALPALAVQADVEETLETPLHHYSACPARMVRDCVVLGHARSLLAAFQAVIDRVSQHAA